MMSNFDDYWNGLDASEKRLRNKWALECAWNDGYVQMKIRAFESFDSRMFSPAYEVLAALLPPRPTI